MTGGDTSADGSRAGGPATAELSPGAAGAASATAAIPDASARSRSFGQAAGVYDRIRPGYPCELIDDVLAHCAGPALGAIEAGAGTGKATTSFADRGLRITAVEPDPAMAAVLAHNCAAYPDVTVVVNTFEEHVPAEPAGLVYCAQAWHWLHPKARRQRVAEALVPGGTLALFWNFDRIADPAVQQAVSAAHKALAPHIDWDATPLAEETLMERLPGPELAEWGAFTGAHARLYRWERALGRQGYLDYLYTHSLYLLLDAGVREELFARIAGAIPDPILLAEDTVLYLARRA